MVQNSDLPPAHWTVNVWSRSHISVFQIYQCVQDSGQSFVQFLLPIYPNVVPLFFSFSTWIGKPYTDMMQSHFSRQCVIYWRYTRAQWKPFISRRDKLCYCTYYVLTIQYWSREKFSSIAKRRLRSLKSSFLYEIFPCKISSLLWVPSTAEWWSSVASVEVMTNRSQQPGKTFQLTVVFTTVFQCVKHCIMKSEFILWVIILPAERHTWVARIRRATDSKSYKI